MSKTSQPAPPRIGTGTWYFAGGWIAILLGVFIGVGSAGSLDRGAGSAFASALIAAGAGLIAIGFWVKLFGLVERRLLDIEQRLAPEPPPSETPERPAATQLPSEAFLG